MTSQTLNMIPITFNPLIFITWSLVLTSSVTSSQLLCSSNENVEAVEVKRWLAQLEDEGLKILEDVENFQPVPDGEQASSDARCNPGEKNFVTVPI